ncbi:hypothetical protein IC006_1031 [Sulfuracidifex tepidarius]|uniref:Uncharacterized protein n=1 Tax=Sulfuracidifex tepidarius TaxID=1294262 RepID=A0A510E1X8_9CREN|nr:hypothetical protein IC006_1031 [Sulfuracidifex tepidarius]BBG26492.1 hypothetical protein IC007_1004 [Sulfuracidifex tepidarius]
MKNGVEVARRKGGKTRLFVDKDGFFYLVVGVHSSCRDRNRLMNEIYDEVYKHTDEAMLMVIVVDSSSLEEVVPKGEEVEVK